MSKILCFFLKKMVKLKMSLLRANENTLYFMIEGRS